jgi:hypothetical protein
VELAVEAKAIEHDEAEGEDEKEEDEDEKAQDLPIVRVAKRKAEALEDDDEEVDQLEEDELDVKWARFATSGLLDFDGLVSFRFSISLVDLLTNSFLSVIDARTSSPSRRVSSTRDRSSASSALSTSRDATGKASRERDFGRSRRREVGSQRALRVQNQVRCSFNRVQNQF